MPVLKVNAALSTVAIPVRQVSLAATHLHASSQWTTRPSIRQCSSYYTTTSLCYTRPSCLPILLSLLNMLFDKRKRSTPALGSTPIVMYVLCHATSGPSSHSSCTAGSHNLNRSPQAPPFSDVHLPFFRWNRRRHSCTCREGEITRLPNSHSRAPRTSYPLRGCSQEVGLCRRYT